ncbi:MAG: diacylglycerol kinase family lipid kinase, partial [Actinomycetota bacterium]|nr:diacylglycerol kinase family lipid kinase [Actinomycetota bacterium]
MSFRLLVNPAAANGRALRQLPAVMAALRRQGVEPLVVQTRSLDHAREEDAAMAREGGTVAAMGGDGFIRPIAGELRDSPARLAVLPGGRGNDFA